MDRHHQRVAQTGAHPTREVERLSESITTNRNGTSSLAAVVLFAGLVWTTGCGDAATEPPPSEPPRPAAVTVNPASVQLEALGATVQLTAEVRDQNGQVIANVAVAWTSSDRSVTAVNASGLVTAAGNGAATITAMAGTVSGSAAVTVAQEVSVVAVSPPAAMIGALGDTLRLSAEALDSNGSVIPDAVFTWTSSDRSVAAVDASGLAMAVDNGTATITATMGSVSGSAAVTVAQEASSVTVSPPAATIAPGDTLRLAAEAFDANGNTVAAPGIDWVSSDRAVALVDASGLVTAVAAGDAEITATAGGVSGAAVVTVARVVSEVVVTSPKDTIAPGDTLRLVAEAFDQNGQAVRGVVFVWSSDNPSVATVDASGLVLGVAEGRVRITATTGGIRGATEIRVFHPDRAVLELLYHSTNGPDWRYDGNWLTDEPLWAWYGVDVGRDGSVTGLELDTNLLNGRIPPEVGQLKSLTRLLLDNNELAGPIPPELGKLTGLTRLLLWDNELSGPIPRELGNLSDLEELRLDRNNLSGPIPFEITDLTNLTLLDLGFNDLTGRIHPELTNLAKLTFLGLAANDLTGRIPAELGTLPELTSLALYSNALSGSIPPELGNLSALTSLRLGTNALTGSIPPELGDLSNLRELNLYNNELTGSIPPELGSLSKLRELDLIDNKLSGRIPSEIGDLSSLTRLRLVNNELNGPIPPEIASLSNLQELWLQYNDLTGSIPSELGGLSSLKQLNLSHNSLSGMLPTELGDLGALVELDLENNRALSGPLPLSLTRLLSLTDFDYSDTKLCVPANAALRQWLDGLDSHKGTGVQCQ